MEYDVSASKSASEEVICLRAFVCARGMCLPRQDLSVSLGIPSQHAPVTVLLATVGGLFNDVFGLISVPLIVDYTQCDKVF